MIVKYYSLKSFTIILYYFSNMAIHNFKMLIVLLLCEHFKRNSVRQSMTWKYLVNFPCRFFIWQQGYVFTGVCDYVHRGWGWRYPSMHWGRHPLPPGLTPPWTDTPCQMHAGIHPPSRWPLQRTVRMLLECILVSSEIGANAYYLAISLAENCMKMKEIPRGGGGTSLVSLPGIRQSLWHQMGSEMSEAMNLFS